MRLRRDVWVVAGALLARGLLAQPVPTRTLTRPDAELEAEWTMVTGVRELADGRAVVVDAREGVPKSVSFKDNTVTLLGRKGNGPGEYGMISVLFALPGDTTVMFDEGNSARPLVLSGGKLGSELAGLGAAAAANFLGSFSAFDASGRLYHSGTGRSAEGFYAIERLDRRTGRIDTVGFFGRGADCASATVHRGRSAGGGAARARQGSSAFVAIEQWAVSADGRVAIVCPKPYRVRLIDASGRETAGPILPFTPVRVTEAEKQAWRDDHAGPVLVLRFGANGQKTTGYEKHPVPEPESWPAAMPPFTMQLQWRKVLAFDPTGMLWIVRSTAADAPPSFDVVDRAGRLAYHVSAPLHTRLVGFGRNTVYLVRRDDDDIEHLQRYALPH